MNDPTPSDVYIAANSLRSKGRALALWADDIITAKSLAEREKALDGIRGIARWLKDDLSDLEIAIQAAPPSPHSLAYEEAP